MRKLIATVALAALLSPTLANAWWERGHRLVGNVAADHLTPMARRNVKALLGTESLADVAAWADKYRPLSTQTGNWHFTDVPADQTAYDRDRDCPTQPGVKKGNNNDKWRDCATDRILFFEARVADATLDPADRATALKYLVHFIGDIHQPMHATGVEAGGNGIVVQAFGSPNCGSASKCNLHSIWDGFLIDHRGINDAQYLARLEAGIRTSKLTAGSTDPAVWTGESKVISNTALVAKGSNIDEEYFNRQIPVIDRQLQMAGLRLAAVLNGIFTTPPQVFHPAPVDYNKY